MQHIPARGHTHTSLTMIDVVVSGEPVRGAPGEGKLGYLRPGALEDSNVDLTAELVNMMTAQRAYQANVAGYMVKSMVGPQFSKLAQLVQCYRSTMLFP